jgi:hypothetical protein
MQCAQGEPRAAGCVRVSEAMGGYTLYEHEAAAVEEDEEMVYAYAAQSGAGAAGPSPPR